jgi:lipoate-protein ligase B
MRTVWLGEVPYPDALSLQMRLAGLRRQHQTPDVLLLLTHPPTITLGRAAHDQHVLADAGRLADLGVQSHRVGRGGDVTYHGPGQLVGYPIVDLAARKPDVHWYLRTLEQALMDAITALGLAPRRFPPHTGVWIAERKVAAIGVQVRRWVTTHGFALNVEADLAGFHLIVPCGIREFGVTSLSAELGRECRVSDAVGPVAASFARHFPGPADVDDEGGRLPEDLRRIIATGLDPLTGPVLDSGAFGRPDTA